MCMLLGTIESWTNDNYNKKVVYLSNDERQYNKRLSGPNEESLLGPSCLLLLFICSMVCGALLVQ